MTKRGISIRLYLPDGTPGGLRIIERSNWTGIVFLSSTAETQQLLSRPEVSRPGVYILVGQADEAGDREIYVGEADDVSVRLRQHIAKGDETWREILVATRKDTTLNKAHVRWLERELIARAREAKRATLRNGNSGFAGALHEAEIDDLYAYLDDLLVLLPILGLDVFDLPDVPTVAQAREPLRAVGAGSADAQGYDTNTGFVITSGHARVEEVASLSAGVRALRRKLMHDGVLLATENGTYRFVQPHKFASPSNAAEVVLGRPANGLAEWKNSSGIPLKEIRANAADAAGTHQVRIARDEAEPTY